MSTLAGITYKDVTPESGQLCMAGGYWTGKRTLTCAWDDSMSLMVALCGRIMKVGGGTFITRDASEFPLPTNTIGLQLVPQRITRERYLGTPAVDTLGGPKGTLAVITVEYGENGLACVHESAEYQSEVLTIERGAGVKWAASASAAIQGKSVGMTIMQPLATVVRSFHFEGVTYDDIVKLETITPTNPKPAFSCVNCLNDGPIEVPRIGREPLTIPDQTAVFLGANYHGKQSMVFGTGGLPMNREPLFEVDLVFKCRGIGSGATQIQGWNQAFSSQTNKWEPIDPIYTVKSMNYWLNAFYSRIAGVL